jgi:hypothetical protein
MCDRGDSQYALRFAPAAWSSKTNAKAMARQCEADSYDCLRNRSALEKEHE